MQTIKYGKIVGERFESINELFKITDNREVTSWWKGDSSSDSRTHDSGKGDVTYEDSKRELLNGSDRYTKDFEKVHSEVTADVRDYLRRVPVNRTKLDVVGSSVSVGRVMAGHPRAMRRRVADRKPKKVVEICYSVSCPWHYAAELRLKYGCVILAAAELLEKKGYSVAITLFADITTDNGQDKICLAEVPIKSFSSPFNLNKLQYPMGSKAALFHMGCRWHHRFPEGFYSYGDGKAPEHTGRQKEVIDYCDSKGAVYMSHVMMKEKLGDGNFERVINYIEKELERIAKAS